MLIDMAIELTKIFTYEGKHLGCQRKVQAVWFAQY